MEDGGKVESNKKGRAGGVLARAAACASEATPRGRGGVPGGVTHRRQDELRRRVRLALLGLRLVARDHRHEEAVHLVQEAAEAMIALQGGGAHARAGGSRAAAHRVAAAPHSTMRYSIMTAETRETVSLFR